MIESSRVRHILRDVGTLRLNAPLFCLSVDRFYESFAKDFELFDDCRNIRHQCCLVTDAAICWHRTIHVRYLQHTAWICVLLTAFYWFNIITSFCNCCTEYWPEINFYLLTNTNNIIKRNVEIV